MDTKIKIAISSCLMGHEVRYNGGHKRHNFLMNELSHFVEWRPFCPEVAIGLGVPRPTLRLVGSAEDPRLVMPKTNEDYTEKMQSYARGLAEQLKQEDIHGIILKSASPSCGLRRVKVYSEKGFPTKSAVGIFANEIVKSNFLLPVEEDGRMNDPMYRENFIFRVFAWKEWTEIIDSGISMKKLYHFHAKHKYRLMAHSPKLQKELGQLLASKKEQRVKDLADEYIKNFMTVLTSPVNKKRHANSLFHISGYFKKFLSSDEKDELGKCIEHYRNGIFPLILPLSFLNHYAKKYKINYLLDQSYLKPHPEQLKLMNNI